MSAFLANKQSTEAFTDFEMSMMMLSSMFLVCTYTYVQFCLPDRDLDTHSGALGPTDRLKLLIFRSCPNT